MRKLISLMLALVLALSCMTALAEETEYAAYTHPTQGYSLEVPSAWYFIDTETIASFVKTAVDGGLEGVDPTFAANLESQVASTDMAMFLAVDGTNVNIVRQNLGVALSAESFMSMVMPSMLTQYEALFEDVTFPDHGSVYYTEDDRAFCSLTVAYLLNGAPISCTQYFYLVGTDMYVFTLTVGVDVAEETAAQYQDWTIHMLDTFVPVVE